MLMGSHETMILMVEDDADVHLVVREFLDLPGHRAELLSAFTLDEGVEIFRAHRERLALIILDACLTPYVLRIDTLSLLEEIKASGFQGPVISSSSDRGLRKQMCELGCTAGVDKGELLNVLRLHL
jgi:DNA-binding response OmpR family regulator